MTLHIFETIDIFESLQEEWLALLDQAEINQVFMTPQFAKSWWQSLGGKSGQKLQILLFRVETENLVVIFPLYSEGSTLSLIGDRTVADYLDVIIEKNLSEEIFAEFFKWFKNSEFFSLSLFSVPHKSPTLQLIKVERNTSNLSVQETQQEVCPVISLPKNWVEYLSSIGKKQRHEIKRKWQNLQEVQPGFELVTHPSEEDIADFISLHQTSSKDKKDYWDSEHEQFFHLFVNEAAKAGWLLLYFLEIGDRRVATMLGFNYQNQFFLYNSGFDAEQYRNLSVGNVLTAYTIKEAIEKGKIKYDFLRGSEEYKLRFGAVAEPVFDVLIAK
jgi:CelD/BcsL family acetyltransferase involved in cellulose biosynthesis